MSGLKPSINKSKFDVSFQLQTSFSTGALFPVNYHRFWPGEIMIDQTFGSFMIQTLSVDVMDEIEGWYIEMTASDYDLYDDAYKVLGHRDSLMDDSNRKLPYIVNCSVPLYRDKDKLKNLITKNEVLNFDSNSIFLEDDKLNSSAYNGVATTFEFNGMTFNIPYSLNWFGAYSSISLNNSFPYDVFINSNFLKAVMPTPKICSLVHYISGVVGDTIKPLNALPYMFYYLAYDTWYRHTKYQNPFFSRDARVDRQYRITNTGEINFTSKFNNYFIPIDDSSIRPGGVPPISYGSCFYPEGFVCNSYDREQRYLTRFLNICGQYQNILSSGSTQYTLNNSFLQFFERLDNSPVVDSKNFAQYYAFFHGGICPVLGRPDFINQLFDTPQQGDPVKILDIDTSKLSSIPVSSTIPSLPIVENGALTLKTGSSNAGIYASSTGSWVNMQFSSAVKDQAAKYVSGLKTSESDLDFNLDLSSLEDFLTVSIDDLRMKFQLNKYLVRANIAGTFIGDIMKTMYGTEIGDSKLRLPKIVGATKIKFNNIPVLQTGASQGEEALQGNLTANSIARFRTRRKVISSSEFGYYMSFIHFGSKQIRHSLYNRDTFEFNKFDLWNPLFNFLSFESIKKKEVFNPVDKGWVSTISGLLDSDDNYNGEDIIASDHKFMFAITDLYMLFGSATDRSTAINRINSCNEVFGYSERYGYKRYAINKVSGLFDPRAQLIVSIDPRYNGLYSSGTAFLTNNLAPSNLSYVNAKSLKHWSLVRDYDVELKGAMQSMSVQNMIDTTPLERSYQISNMQPIYAKFYFARQIVVGLPVFAIPGYADHF